MVGVACLADSCCFDQGEREDNKTNGGRTKTPELVLASLRGMQGRTSEMEELLGKAHCRCEPARLSNCTGSSAGSSQDWQQARCERQQLDDSTACDRKAE